MQLNLSFPPSFPSNVAWHPPLIRKARTRCDLTGFHLAARSAQVLSLGRLACWRSSRPGARGLSARFHTLSLSRAPRLCPVAVDITMLTRRKRRRCWYVTVPIWKNTGETDGNKKTPLHFWSEVFEVINTIWQRPKIKVRMSCKQLKLIRTLF